MKISRVTVFTAVLAILSIPAAQAGTRQLAPGQSVEMVGQATVISTVHYQAMIFLICNGGGCFGDFKRPGANHQLNVSRVACNFSTSSGSTVSSSFISLINAVGATLVFEPTPVEFSSASGSAHAFNRTVDLQIAASQHMRVDVVLNSGTTSLSACTATGTLDTLG